MRLAIVLYSYAGRLGAQRTLARISYETISKISGVTVYVTSRAARPPVEPSCFVRIPLAIDDAYELLPDKTMEMLAWMVQRDDWDLLLKCDDDVFLDPGAVRGFVASKTWPTYAGTALLRLLPNHEPSRYHMGRCRSGLLNSSPLNQSWTTPDFIFAGGACYALSRAAAVAALEELAEWDLTVADARDQLDIRGVGGEDVLLAYLLRRRGILPSQDIELFQPSSISGFVSHLTREAVLRLFRRPRKIPCLGMFSHNRSLRRYERALLRLWHPLSWVLPAVATTSPKPKR